MTRREYSQLLRLALWLDEETTRRHLLPGARGWRQRRLLLEIEMEWGS